MAITLTKSYKKISTISLTYGEIRTYAKYSSQDSATNKTTYQLKFTYYTSQANGVSMSSASGYMRTDDGETTSRSYGYTTFYNETTIKESTRTSTHYDDGSSRTKTVTTHWEATFGGGGTTSATINFPKIDRYPMIKTAPNFTDEDNPTITYSTISGFSGATYSACISLTGSNDDVSYRTIDLSSGSYTFNLTEAERNTLRNATPNSNTLQVHFYVRTTTSGGTNYFSHVPRTMTIINGEPTFTHSELETDSKVTSILGTSASTIVNNISKVKVTIVPTALKGASISSVKVIHNNITYTDESTPYEMIIPVTNNSFTVEITDSRGNKNKQDGTQTITKQLIDYLPFSIESFSFKRPNPTSSDIRVNLEATYYQITVGSTVNAPTVKWKLEESGTYTNIPSSAWTIDNENNKLTISNYTLTNILSHEHSGTFYIKLEDIFSTDENNVIVNKGIPTFEAGENDFQVNGDLIVADTNAENGVNILDLATIEVSKNNENTPTKVSYKFSNGLLINTIKISYSNVGCNTAWGGTYTSVAQSRVNYQTAFTTLLSVNATCRPTTGNHWLMVTESGTTNELTQCPPFSFARGTKANVTGTVFITAVGLWK